MFLTVSIAVLAASLILFRMAGGRIAITKLNMISATLVFLVLFSFIGSVLVVYDVDGQTHLERLSDDAIRTQGWLIIQYAMLGVPLGMVLTNLLLRAGNVTRRFEAFTRRRLEPVIGHSEWTTRLFCYIGCCISVGLFAVFVLRRGLDNVALVNVMMGTDVETLARQRASSSIDLADVPILSSIFGPAFIQMMAYVSYAYWRMSKRRYDLVWFAVMFVITALTLGYNITKAPLLLFFAGFLIAEVAITGSLSWRVISSVAVAGSVLVTAMYIFYRGGYSDTWNDVANVWYDAVQGRILTGQLVSFYYCLDIFPRLQPHIWLASTGDWLHHLFNIPYADDYGLTVMQYLDPVGVRLGVAGHATAYFMGEAWANFGWFGVVFAPLLVGAVIQTFYLHFLNARKTPLHIGTYAYLSLAWPVLSGIKGFYYPAWLVLLLTGIVGIYLLSAIVSGVDPLRRRIRGVPSRRFKAVPHSA
jgi:hypothetical protein